MDKTPVAFFGFNRPDCTKIVFAEIRRYRPEKLFLVADGPRTTVPTDQARCEAVRSIMQAVDWECEVRTNFADQNWGCKKRMSSGIDWVFSQVEEVIFLEDDCAPCPDFFEFCSVLLARYRDNPEIMSIAGTNYQQGRRRGEDSYYFSKFPHIWGWASWRRAWAHYDVEMSSWPQAKKDQWITTVFPTRAEHEFWTEMIDRVYTGKINTWDMQWAYACWRQGGFGIIPNTNLITNIGAGPEATHTKGPTGSVAIPAEALGELRHPQKITLDRAADEFTFATHNGGNERSREKQPVRIIHRNLSRLKRLVFKTAGYLARKLMLKQITKKFLKNAGWQIHRASPSAALSGPLLFGRFTVETDSAELISAYHHYPESNTVIGRLVTLIAQRGKVSMVDIGANCGDTLAIAKAAVPDCEVLCVEGDESLLLSLKKNVRQFTGVTLEQAYLGEVSAQAQVSIEKRGYNNTLVGEQGGEVVSIKTLDDVVRSWHALPQLRFIKCDTEGYDVRILFGARETLQAYQPVVLFEYNWQAMQATGEEGFRVFSYLEKLGYHTILLYDNFGRFLLETNLLQQDTLRDLCDYVQYSDGKINYYDMIVFAHSDAELVAECLSEERLHRKDKRMNS